MKAIVKKERVEGNVASNRKEDSFYYQYTVVDASLNNVLELRLYATNARHYACVWAHASPYYLSGGGYAGGYGYHRASAAAEAAICDAGIKLSDPIGGRGDSAIQDALMAIAKAVTGKRKFKILTAHA